MGYDVGNHGDGRIVNRNNFRRRDNTISTSFSGERISSDCLSLRRIKSVSGAAKWKNGIGGGGGGSAH